MDAYFPFEAAVDAWARCFAGLAIHYRGATMRLDLCDRPGKYSNGFCHWPQPAWRHPDGAWVPSAANFTSLATPSAVGSGRTALVTLLHEGGHAVRGPTLPYSGARPARASPGCAGCAAARGRLRGPRLAAPPASPAALGTSAPCWMRGGRPARRARPAGQRRRERRARGGLRSALQGDARRGAAALAGLLGRRRPGARRGAANAPARMRH